MIHLLRHGPLAAVLAVVCAVPLSLVPGATTDRQLSAAETEVLFGGVNNSCCDVKPTCKATPQSQACPSKSNQGQSTCLSYSQRSPIAEAANKVCIRFMLNESCVVPVPSNQNVNCVLVTACAYDTDTGACTTTSTVMYPETAPNQCSDSSRCTTP